MARYRAKTSHAAIPKNIADTLVKVDLNPLKFTFTPAKKDAVVM